MLRMFKLLAGEGGALPRFLKFGLMGCVWLVGLLLLVGCGGPEGSGSQSNDEPSEPSTTKSSEKTSTATRESAAERTAVTRGRTAEAPAPIELSGNGQMATEPFKLQNGLFIARMSYQGQSNFIVNILAGNGGQGASFANVIGSFEGSYASSSAAGEYLLDVKASGPWTITIEQPRPSSAPETRSFQGAGKTATAFFTLSKGLNGFELAHQGGSNFIVGLLDENGASVGMGLVNEIGPFEGSKAVQVPKDGIYLLQVEADGPWAIQIT